MTEHETDVLEILQRMQQQLSFLEKKIDALIHNSQSQSRPFNRERNFSRPARPFGRPHRPGGPDSGHAPSHGYPRHNNNRPRGRQ